MIILPRATDSVCGVRTPRLNRVTFTTSREMDFFSEKELVTQTGHATREWPLVIVKELIDNSLDACEEADIAPVIDVRADATGISVSDNGPGLPEATLKAAMDFTVRASNREAYVSPCRGAQGNALKTLLPMPRVLDPEGGRLIVTANGRRHVITCGADPISQRAVIHDDATDEKVKTSGDQRSEKASCFAGTEVRLEWAPRQDGTSVQWPFLDASRHPLRPQQMIASDIRQLVEGFALFNPHTTITLHWFGRKTIWEATAPAWPKWKPSQPTSAHWYSTTDFERLIGAYVTHDRDTGSDRLVSELIAEFDGLSGSAKRKRVLDAAGLQRAKLSELVVGNRLDGKRLVLLLTAMQAQTRRVDAKRLGLIGAEHLKARLLGMGVVPESFRYSRKLSDAKSKNLQPAPDEKASCLTLPGVVESAFGWLGEDAEDCRRIYTGANWSAAIKNPFRTFGTTGEGLETVLAEMRATSSEPVIVVLHLAQPRVRYTDRGKSALTLQ